MRDKIGVDIVSTNMPGLLSRLLECNVSVEKIQQKEPLVYSCLLDRKNYETACEIAAKRGDKITQNSQRGVRTLAENILKRPFIVLGTMILLTLTMWLPTRVLFITVEGNESLSDKRILEEVARSGLFCGVARKEVRSEQVKNQLLSTLPELQWAGVNTRGCSATISVKEKQERQHDERREVKAGNIVAARDGVITNCIVQNGNPLCSVGKAVKAGQVLVSGYIDCGLWVRMVDCEAEIAADTVHNLDAIVPVTGIARTEIKNQKRTVRLMVGKKLINFSKDSGILDTRCVKIYESKYMTLPGGKVLPVVLIIETCMFYETADRMIEPVFSENMLREYSNTYLTQQMIAGHILKSEYRFYRNDDHYYLQGKYLCNEIIGKNVREERLYTDGENF